MSFRKRIGKWFEIDDEYDYEDYEEERVDKGKETTLEQSNVSQLSERTVSNQRPTVVSLESAKKVAKVVLFEPRAYSEAVDVADELLKKKAVIVNLQQISQQEGGRIIDFLSGTVYAISGEMQKIGQDIFLCTPDNVEVDGEISQYIDSK